MTDTTSGKPWRKPVTLELHGAGKYRTITSTQEAAECLMSSWPVTDGLAFHHALEVCFRVMEGDLAPDMAREAFLHAAEEAAIYVRP